MSLSTNIARQARRAHAARERTCTTCSRECPHDSRRRARCRANGSCPQWTYRNADHCWKQELPPSLLDAPRNMSPVLALRADGTWKAWPSVTSAARDLGLPACRVTAMARRREHLDGWQISYLRESVRR